MRALNRVPELGMPVCLNASLEPAGRPRWRSGALGEGDAAGARGGGDCTKAASMAFARQRPDRTSGHALEGTCLTPVTLDDNHGYETAYLSWGGC